jgi:acetylornithine deacetylase/succinyl-diaminopimelate desuccinylase-like protein
MLDAVLNHIEKDHPAAVQRLVELSRIASVSTDPAYSGQVQQAAELVVQRLRGSGLRAELWSTAGHPCVFAESVEVPGAPTVLFYGHYDVQPPDPIEKWHTPPFEPTLRDGAIYARGASDDKGQISCFLEALDAWHRTAGRLPCNVKVLIEGEEEMGSVNLPPVIEQHKDRLAADVVLVSDTSMWETTPGQPRPSIVYALRGLVYFDVQLHGPSRDLHSGVFGGTLPNPCTILTRILAGLFDAQHRVTIPGYYDDVLQLTDDERRAWSKLDFTDETFLGEVGVHTPYGESGYSTLERRWSRPACDINGIYGGYMGEGAKTVIPMFAGAKVSFRIVANQDPGKIAQGFETWLRDQDTHGLRWEITNHGEAAPTAAPTDSTHMAAARRAVRRVFDTDPVFIREGATIPIVADFKHILGLDTILLGFGRVNDCLHSPNEKFDLRSLKWGSLTHAALLHEIAAC